ncbi:hypothetical protein [Azospirillum melinis]
MPARRQLTQSGIGELAGSRQRRHTIVCPLEHIVRCGARSPAMTLCPTMEQGRYSPRAGQAGFRPITGSEFS